MARGWKVRPEARRRVVHRFFELGILLKGIDGGLELIGGILLLVLSREALTGVIYFLVRGELAEDPTDPVVHLLLRGTQSLIEARTAASGFLMVHGATKLLLVGGLATRRRWSYPAAIAVFAGFTVYQIYQLGHRYSLFLVMVTALDIVVVVLIAVEYRYVRMARKG